MINSQLTLNFQYPSTKSLSFKQTSIHQVQPVGKNRKYIPLHFFLLHFSFFSFTAADSYSAVTKSILSSGIIFRIITTHKRQFTLFRKGYVQALLELRLELGNLISYFLRNKLTDPNCTPFTSFSLRYQRRMHSTSILYQNYYIYTLFHLFVVLNHINVQINLVLCLFVCL